LFRAQEIRLGRKIFAYGARYLLRAQEFIAGRKRLSQGARYLLTAHNSAFGAFETLTLDVCEREKRRDSE
jgi:hypothetical protein